MRKTWKSPFFSHFLVPLFLAQVAFKIFQNELIPASALHSQPHSRAPLGLTSVTRSLDLGRAREAPGRPLSCSLLPAPPGPHCLSSSASAFTSLSQGAPSNPGVWSPAAGLWPEPEVQGGTTEHTGFRLKTMAQGRERPLVCRFLAPAVVDVSECLCSF